jgi:hypothetical protein
LNTLRKNDLYNYWRQLYFINPPDLQTKSIKGKAIITFTYPILHETTSLSFETTNTGVHTYDNTAPFPNIFEDVTDITAMATSFCSQLTAASGGTLTANVIETRGYSEVDIEIYENNPTSNVFNVIATNSASLKQIIDYEVQGYVEKEIDPIYEPIYKEILFLTKRPRNSFLQVRNNLDNFYANDQNGNYHSYTTASLLIKNFTIENCTESYYKIKATATKTDNNKVERVVNLLDTIESQPAIGSGTYLDSFGNLDLNPKLEFTNGLFHISTYYKHYFPSLDNNIKDITFQVLISFTIAGVEYLVDYSEPLTYKIVAPNIVNTKVIKYLNSLGGWDEILCDRTIKTEVESDVLTYTSSLPVYNNKLDSYQVSPVKESLNGDFSVGEISINETFTCRASATDRDEWVYYKELLTSPSVYEQVAFNEFKAINITKSNWIDNIEESSQLLEFTYRYLSSESVKVKV